MLDLCVNGESLLTHIQHHREYCINYDNDNDNDNVLFCIIMKEHDTYCMYYKHRTNLLDKQFCHSITLVLDGTTFLQL